MPSIKASIKTGLLAKGSVLALIVSSVGFAPSVYAQTNTDKDEIVVTARKSEENLQSVPISVSAFTEQLIQDANIANINDLSAMTPGFQQQQAFGRDADRPVMRGTSNILISEGKVGIFLDGVPVVGDTSAMDFNSFERVEVIRGPQSALFGRGTLSGAINYVTRKPSNEFTANLKGTVAEWGQYEAFGAVSGPIIKNKLYGYLSGKYYEFDGDYTNTITGSHLGQKSKTINAGLQFEPSDQHSFSLRYIFSDDDDDHYPIALQGADQNNCQLNSRGYFCGEVQSPTSIALNTDDLIAPGLQRETHRILGTADIDLGDSGYSLTGLFGYTDIDEISGSDQSFDATAPLFITSPFVCSFFIPNCVFGATAFHGTGQTTREAISGEVRLLSPRDSNFRWHAGVSLFKDERTPTLFGVQQTEFGYDAIDGGRKTKNSAVFGGAELDIGERLTVGAELRYAGDRIETFVGPDYIAGDEIPGATTPTTVVSGDGADRSEKFTSFTPRITVDYQYNDDVLLYGVVSSGTSPGGFNAIDAPKTAYDEETLWNYEIGVKSRPMEDVQLNLAGFFLDYGNQVLTSTFTTQQGGVQSFSDNVGDTEIWGLEVEGSATLSEFLDISGTYSYLDAEIVKGLNADQALLFGGVGCAGVDFINNDVTLPAGTVIGDGSTLTTATPCATFADLSGQKAPLVSKHQASLSADLHMPLMDTGFEGFIRGDFTYRSSFFAQIHNLAETGAAKNVNLSAGVRKDGLRVSFWLKNAFNDDTPVGILRYVDFSAARINGQRPRAFGITPPRKRQAGVTVSADF